MVSLTPLAVLIIPAAFILAMMLKICKEAYWPPPRRQRSEDLPAPAFDSSGRPLTIYWTFTEAREFVETGKVARHEKMIAAGKAAEQATVSDKTVLLSALV
jgi:hypothetical protein